MYVVVVDTALNATTINTKPRHEMAVNVTLTSHSLPE